MSLPRRGPRPRAAHAVVLLLALVALVAAPASARAQNAQRGERLVVATKEIAPFVLTDQDAPRGLSIHLWEEIAAELDLDYEYLIVDTVTEQIDAVAEGRADLAIAAITITREREERVDFSLPYYDSALTVLIADDDQHVTIGMMLRSFFSRALLSIFVLFGICVLVVAHVVWLVERRDNEDFPHAYLPGIGEALWWAVVTVTTVGYGDRTPEGRWGRAFALLWMLFGIVLVAQFTATITSELALRQIESRIERLTDLEGRGVGTVEGSTSERLLIEHALVHRTYPSLEATLVALERGAIEAVLYDEPVLRYERARAGEPGWTFVGEPVNQELYGIALREGSALREPLNQALLERVESGRLDELERQWLSGAALEEGGDLAPSP